MKSYAQFCGAAYALDIIGERWTLLIIRELLPGPRRYKDLMTALPGLTTNLLAARLKAMTDTGLIKPDGKGYTLTREGRRLETVVLSLAEYGTGLLPSAPLEGQQSSLRNLAVNLKWRIAGSWTGCIALETGDQRVFVTGTPQGLDVADTSPTPPIAKLTGQNGGLMRWILKGQPAPELIAQNLLTISGPAQSVLDLDRALGPPRRP